MCISWIIFHDLIPIWHRLTWFSITDYSWASTFVRIFSKNTIRLVLNSLRHIYNRFCPHFKNRFYLGYFMRLMRLSDSSRRFKGSVGSIDGCGISLYVSLISFIWIDKCILRCSQLLFYKFIITKRISVTFFVRKICLGVFTIYMYVRGLSDRSSTTHCSL